MLGIFDEIDEENLRVHPVLSSGWKTNAGSKP